jgi:hypothetical protein
VGERKYAVGLSDGTAITLISRQIKARIWSGVFLLLFYPSHADHKWRDGFYGLMIFWPMKMSESHRRTTL